MPEIQIRPAVNEDIPHLIAIDHDYTTDHVWQLDVVNEEGQVEVNFRQARLPRSVRVDYPRSPHELENDWDQRSGLLAALIEEEVVGYVSVMQGIAPMTTWINDLAVLRKYRRQGIGSSLVLAAEVLGRQYKSQRLVLEMQPKNYPAIKMAQKLGFEFCGYNDRYYKNGDIAMFFARQIR
jgi:ribosomal protein S18 acetylase RimI-like enzyme